MTMDPASPFGPTTDSWQARGNFPHHFHQVSQPLSSPPPASSQPPHVVDQLPPPPQPPLTFQPPPSNALNQLPNLPVLYFTQAKLPEESTLVDEVHLDTPNPRGAWINTTNTQEVPHRALSLAPLANEHPNEREWPQKGRHGQLRPQVRTLMPIT